MAKDVWEMYFIKDLFGTMVVHANSFGGISIKGRGFTQFVNP